MSSFERRSVVQGVPLVILLALAAGPAVASAAPSVGGPSVGPQEEACKGRAAGDACTLPNRQLGTCASSTCNRLDYSQGSPPRAIEAECLVCEAGGANAGEPSPVEPPMVGSGGPPSGGEPTAGEHDGTPSTRDDSSAPPTTASRCRVADDADGVPAFGLGLLGLLGLARRRRRA